MQAVLTFCWRLLADCAAVLIGWTSLDIAWDWLVDAPIAQSGWVRYLVPTIAAALTAALAPYVRPSAPAIPPPPPATGWRALLGINWAGMLALIAAYEAAGRLLASLRWVGSLSLRAASAVLCAVVLGLATAYLVHWLLQRLQARQTQAPPRPRAWAAAADPFQRRGRVSPRRR
ncbi:MAG: hypothetical protein HYR63_28630 [Proteobacteria bacterium]|nr:hypothetical protein [Pseudomonadota bacterium]MBI3496847.1 hypothetical protein [Pseudomonadota bacterium]